MTIIKSSLGYIRSVAVTTGLLALAACNQPDTTLNPPDTTIFAHGDILTMDASAPTAEALAMKDGIITAVGTLKDVRAASPSNALIRDLSGQTLIPGMIDAHGHFGGGAFVSTMADLQPPPAGKVANITQLTKTLTDWQKANPESDWIVGMGYDDSLLAEGRHPTRADLDAISPTVPIMIMHVSGHLLSCNSPCLKAAGVDASTPNPAGGVFRRIGGSNEPNGVVEETAMQAIAAKMPRPSARAALEALSNYQTYYARHGLTTAQDGATSLELLKVLYGIAQTGQLKLDLAAYPHVKSAAEFDETQISDKTYDNHFRRAGIKLVLDGSPQGKTAWLTHPFHEPPDGKADDYAGYPIMKDADVNTIIKQAFERKVQVIAHANGDAAADQLINAVKLANAALGQTDHRTVMIHAQTVRADQVEAMKAEGIIPSYFASHTFFWGDWHRDSVLGEARAARISPLKSSLDAGITFTIHNDAPIVPPDMIRLMWAAVNRETRSGKILGPDERISGMEALKAVTINAAYQNFEEDAKGSLTVGKIADLVILSANPAAVSPRDIIDIKIMETIKDGNTLYSAP